MTVTAAAVGPQGYSGSYSSCEASVPRARLDLRMILSTWHLEDLADDAEWIATELVTNAVQHGRGSPRLSVCRKDSGIEIAVFDSSRALPQVRNATVQDEGGRGLRIVDNLSSRWGVDTLRGGKRVWAMLNC